MNRNGVRNRGIYNYYNNPPHQDYLTDWEDYVYIIQNMPDLNRWYDFSDDLTVGTISTGSPGYYDIDYINNKGINKPILDDFRLISSRAPISSSIVYVQPNSPFVGTDPEFSYGIMTSTVHYLQSATYSATGFTGNITQFIVVTTQPSPVNSAFGDKRGITMWDHPGKPESVSYDMCYIDQAVDDFQIIGQTKVFKNPDPNADGYDLNIEKTLYVNKRSSVNRRRYNLFQQNAVGSWGFYQGKIWEVIVLSHPAPGLSSTVDIQIVTDYLELKYGLKEQY